MSLHQVLQGYVSVTTLQDFLMTIVTQSRQEMGTVIKEILQNLKYIEAYKEN